MASIPGWGCNVIYDRHFLDGPWPRSGRYRHQCLHYDSYQYNVGFREFKRLPVSVTELLGSDLEIFKGLTYKFFSAVMVSHYPEEMHEHVFTDIAKVCLYEQDPELGGIKRLTFIVPRNSQICTIGSFYSFNFREMLRRVVVPALALKFWINKFVFGLKEVTPGHGFWSPTEIDQIKQALGKHGYFEDA